MQEMAIVVNGHCRIGHCNFREDTPRCNWKSQEYRVWSQSGDRYSVGVVPVGPCPPHWRPMPEYCEVRRRVQPPVVSSSNLELSSMYIVYCRPYGMWLYLRAIKFVVRVLLASGPIATGDGRRILLLLLNSSQYRWGREGTTGRVCCHRRPRREPGTYNCGTKREREIRCRSPGTKHVPRPLPPRIRYGICQYVTQLDWLLDGWIVGT